MCTKYIEIYDGHYSVIFNKALKIVMKASHFYNFIKWFICGFHNLEWENWAGELAQTSAQFGDERGGPYFLETNWACHSNLAYDSWLGQLFFSHQTCTKN